MEDQRRTQEICWKPEITPQRVDLLNQHVWKKEEQDLSEQQLWNLKRNSALDQEELKYPCIKEEPVEPELTHIKEEPEPTRCEADQGQLKRTQIKEELQQSPSQEEPEPSLIKEEQEEPEPSLIKEELEPSLIKEELEPSLIKEELEPSHIVEEQNNLELLCIKEELELSNITKEQGEPEPAGLGTDQEDVEHLLIKEEHGQLELSDIKEEQGVVELSCIKKEHKELEPEGIVAEQEEPEPEGIVADCGEPEHSQFEDEHEEPQLLSFLIHSSQQIQQLLVNHSTDAFMDPWSSQKSSFRDSEPNIDHLYCQSGAEAQVQSQEGTSCPVSESPAQPDPDTPVKCDVCGKVFKYEHSLVEHQGIHSGVKPYACNTCGKSFTQPSGLKVHMRIHTVNLGSSAENWISRHGPYNETVGRTSPDISFNLKNESSLLHSELFQQTVQYNHRRRTTKAAQKKNSYGR
ncbi:hypothetical protein ILYODFUR_015643 [Ilyodon furcidens]|uniref:C2H2-type domain-containing protein n=1 Tax=Ilyodon furcidens TaxID=33524 RepID=A0ABV0VEZ0_9TELE